MFIGAKAVSDATVANGAMPLVLLSHGGLRSAPDSGAWLAARLAEAGFVVAEINPPRGASAQDAADEVWRRPEDIRRTLDLLLVEQDWSSQINREKITVVGFALGGTAALAIAGAQFDVRGYVGACEGDILSPDCGWFSAQGVSLDGVDRAALATDRSDERVSAVVALNPEYLDILSTSQSDGWASDVLAIHLRPQKEQISVQDGVNISEAYLENATVYDGFSICTPDGAAILGEDAALCASTPQARGMAHDQIANEIVDHLQGLFE